MGFSETGWPLAWHVVVVFKCFPQSPALPYTLGVRFLLPYTQVSVYVHMICLAPGGIDALTAGLLGENMGM